MNESQGRKKEKNQHIQVFVRVRPANHQELLGKSPSVIDVPSNRDIVVRERLQDKHTKKFTFDRVFGPTSKQLDVYNAVASPLLDEVLAGYNCTVFAYGQTGTGKTFTMEGTSNDPALHWQSDTTAGLIPRALSHLFDELRLMGSQEYTVRVSFLELYNEELFDLLSPTEDASKIRIYDDASKRGAVIIQGLEEVTVHNKNEVYKILEKGSERRQTAATLMNAASSRSHTVFSITVHIRENTVEGEELLKTGKLNLVDLAGSENVGRSGAVDKRAREAGNINQSLLTLGRVITALVERTPHVPYRESKLTRLLQESLGGRTKTSIIATISPASLNLEETLSTLDYAHRAKNITNRPEINQKLTKKALLKEYTEEIERLRRDLQASRERNGVYLAHENYNEMQSTIEFQGKEIEEKINHIKALEETMLSKEKLLSELKMDLKSTKRQVELTEQERDEQKHLVEKHFETETKLLQQAKALLNVADVATTDTYKLHDKIIRKQTIEESNMSVSEIFRENIRNKFSMVEQDISKYTDELTKYYSSLKTDITGETTKYSKILNQLTERVSNNLFRDQKAITELIKLHCETSQKKHLASIENCIQSASNFTNSEREMLKKTAVDLAPMIAQLVDNRVKENLEIMNDEMTQSMNHLVEHVKELTEKTCSEFFQSRNHLQYELNAVRKNLEYSRKKQIQLTEINQKFSQRINAFTEDCLAFRNEQDEENLRIVDSFETELEICSNLNTEVENMTGAYEELKKINDNEIPARIDTIVTSFSSEMKRNCDISAQCIEQSRSVIEQLQNQLEQNCQSLSTYEDNIRTLLQEVNVQSQAERSEVLALTEKIDQVVKHAANDHQNCVNELGQAIQTNFKNITEILEKKTLEASNMQQKLVSSMHETHSHVEKFIAEDLQHDQQTGQTPIKRDFQYPRHLTATSPHEKILQRFRTLRYQEGSMDNDDGTLADGSPHQFLVPSNNIRSSNSSLSTKSSRKSDDDMHHVIVRSASASDIPSTRDKSPLHNASTALESDQTPRQNNKENKEELIVGSVPKTAKYGYKGKPTNKTVLRSRNDI